MFDTELDLVEHYERLADSMGMLFDSLAYEDPEKNKDFGYAFFFDVENDCSMPMGEFKVVNGVYYAL